MNPDGDENQNNLNGAPNADPTQQAIFTPVQAPAPEPPRPAQNSSVVVGSVVEPASTGLSHQYYSNHPTKTSASGIGDIVVKEDRPRKTVNKKLLSIIGAVLVSVVIIGLIILGAINNNTPKTLETSFKAYAGYLLYEDSEDDIWAETNQSDDYITMSDYALYQHFYAPDHTEYFDSLTGLFNRFVAKYNSVRAKLGINAEYIDQYIENYQVINILSGAPAINYSSVRSLLTDFGEDGVWVWIEDNFSRLNAIESGREYYGMVREYAELIIYGENDPTTWEREDEILNRLTLIQSYLIDSLQQGCWEIWEIIMEQNNA